MISNLLVAARGPVDEMLEPVMMSHVVTTVVTRFRSRRPLRTVTVEVEREPGIALAVPSYAEQVIGNLLSNADKYSPTEVPIEIIVTTSADEVWVRALDRGTGIEDVDVDRLFDAFFRSSSTARSREAWASASRSAGD